MIIRWRYKVFYKIDDYNKKVIVYRILSSSKNFEKLV